MSATLSPNIMSVGDIVQYNHGFAPWEDCEILRINQWEFNGVHYISYDLRFEDDDMLVDIDPSGLRRKPVLFDHEVM